MNYASSPVRHVDQALGHEVNGPNWFYNPRLLNVNYT